MAIIPGVIPFSGPIGPTDSSDIHATHIADYGQDGWRSVTDITARDAITTLRRKQGMAVFVQSEKKLYILKDGITNLDWVEFMNGASVLTLDQLDAIQDANLPGSTNVFATMNDLVNELTVDQKAAIDGATAPSSSNVFITGNDMPDVSTLPTQDQKDALDNANTPSSTNPFATLSDVSNVLTQDQLDAIQNANNPSIDNVVSTFEDIAYTGTTTATVGGISEGTTYSQASAATIFRDLLEPYQYPSFSAFSITTASQTIEVGSLLSGIQTFSWNLNHVENITANTLQILNVDNNNSIVQNHSLASPYNYNFSSDPFQPIKRVSPGSYTWRVIAQNTKVPTETFQRDYSMYWKWNYYAGNSVNDSLTNAQILALSNQSPTGGYPSQVSFPGGDTFFWLWVVSTATQPTVFKDHATGFPIDKKDTITQTITNSYGISTSYKGYCSTYPLSEPVLIDIS